MEYSTAKMIDQAFSLVGDAARAFDIWSAGSSSFLKIDQSRVDRLNKLVRHARANSPFFQRHYRHRPSDISDVTQLPPVTRTELMSSFDDWVTDRNVTLQAVTGFQSDRERIGALFQDRYAVWKSSGTSGHPGIFLHDQRALAIYDQLFAQRAWAAFPFRIMAPSFWSRPWRMACVTACEDHFAGISSWRRLAMQQPLLAQLMRDFSVLKPLGQLVEELNAWQPWQIVAYPSVLALLAKEQSAGRLGLSPAAIFAGGETLDGYQQDLIESAFDCAVRGVYACSECDYIAFQCAHRNYHVNADWVIVEPVDVEHRPVEPGSASHTVLLTNLANYVQPIIRYELGDSVTQLAERCPCGNPLPAIRIEGRCDEVLYFDECDGGGVTILPMAITTVLDLIPNLRRFQIVREAEKSLRMACEFAEGSDEIEMKSEVISAVARFLADNGLTDVRITVDGSPPLVDPISGKFHQVIDVAGV